MKAWKALLATGIALLLLTAGCVQETAVEGNGGEAGTATVLFKYTDFEGNAVVEKGFEVEKGTNAWEAMKRNVSYDYEEFEFGPFVTSIAGVAPPQGYYLALYVNGEYATAGIGEYTVEDDMSMEWKTEKIEAFGQ